MQALTFLLAWALLAIASTGGAAAASSQTQSAFEAGQRAFAEQDYARALSHFEDARAAGLDGAAVHYNIGVCQYRLGDYPAAGATFALIAERYPAMRGLAQYNLGLVARRQGRQADAELFFRQALATSDDETVTELARRQLGEPAPAAAPRRRWFSMIDTRFGHDDNVILLADDIPLPEGMSARSSFTELFGMASGPLSHSAFRFDGSFYAARYQDASPFDQNALQAGLAYEWDFDQWRAEVGPYYNYSTLDGTTLEHRFGGSARVRRSLGERTALALRFIHDEVKSGANRFDYLEGSRDLVEARVDHRHRGGRVTAAYSFEHNERSDPGVSPTRNKLTVRYRHAFSSSWLADVGLSWRRSRYGDLTEPRTERLNELSGALTRLLPRGWQLHGALTLGDNDSTQPAVRYDRQRFSVGFAKQL